MRKNKGWKLEHYIVEKLIESGIDPYARITIGSGNSKEVLDVSNNVFFVECRQHKTKNNWIIQRKKDYIDSICKLPITTQKELIIVKENKFGEKMITMEAEAFFRILEKIKDEKEDNWE